MAKDDLPIHDTPESICIGGQNTSVGYDNPLQHLTTGSGCVAIGYPNLSCPAFGSGCEILPRQSGTDPKNILIGKPI